MINISFQYKPFLDLQFRHDYYMEKPARDLSYIPLESTRVLLDKLGFVVRNTDDGLKILFDLDRSEALAMKLEKVDHLSVDLWLTCAHPYFFNVTELSIEHQNKILLLQNKRRDTDGTYHLHNNEYVNDTCFADVFPPNFSFDVPKGVSLVEVIDSANEVVFAQEVPKDSGSVYIKGLNLGYHRISVDGNHHSEFVVMPAWGLRYPIGFIRIVLDKAQLEEVLASIKKSGTISTFLFSTYFKARSTYWKYLIISKYSDGLKDTVINTDDKSIKFVGPSEVKLLNGETAFQFLSSQTLQLQEYCKYVFQLNRKNGASSSSNKILVKRMPYPTIDSLRSHNDEKNKDHLYSEILIYV